LYWNTGKAGKLGPWSIEKIICTTTHPLFLRKELRTYSERIENKGSTLQRATKSPEVADNNGDTLRIAEISSFEGRT
jgi:hypothetical protein